MMHAFVSSHCHRPDTKILALYWVNYTSPVLVCRQTSEAATFSTLLIPFISSSCHQQVCAKAALYFFEFYWSGWLVTLTIWLKDTTINQSSNPCVGRSQYVHQANIQEIRQPGMQRACQLVFSLVLMLMGFEHPEFSFIFGISRLRCVSSTVLIPPPLLYLWTDVISSLCVDISSMSCPLWFSLTPFENPLQHCAKTHYCPINTLACRHNHTLLDKHTQSNTRSHVQRQGSTHKWYDIKT